MAELTTERQQDQQSLQRENERLRASLAELQSRLKEPEEIVRAIRHGEVDAFVVTEPPGERIYTLRSADLLFKVLIEEMQEGALALDEKGIILYCNRHFATLMKTRREGILGTSIFPFVSPDDQVALDIFGGGLVHGTRREEVLLKAIDGSSVPVMLTINPLRIEGLMVFCAIVTDLTEQKQQQELLTASQRKDVFLAMLSHELRNPIAPIRNAAHVLRLEQVSTEDVHWAGEVIERQVLQLTRLVDDLLDVARISSGKINLRMDTVDLRGAIGAAVEESRPRIDARAHQLTVDVPAGALLVQGDAARLTQVIANLLNNAAKFTPTGGRISVTAERQVDEAVVRVRDTGRGIPAEMLPRVFDVFTQVDTSEGRAEGGLGIGLALVKTIVEMHGGEVSAASQGSEQGAEFAIRLPLLREQPQQLPTKPPVSAWPHRPCRVLIVDDNHDAADSMAMLVQHWGHQVQVALTPHEGLEKARSLQPKVVFMDIGMPGMSGYDLAREFRQVPGLDRAVLVAVTGYGQEEDRRRTREAGFDHHWVKPANLESMETLLRAVGSESA
ncbi:MAG TPA: ATP-binding protein [Pirellulaceae bacterium]|nr:ATP-binding protein [Pirellulaceae bacterium]